jgi:hypothetical protein
MKSKNANASIRLICIILAAGAAVFALSCETGPDISKVDSTPNANTGSTEQELSGEYVITGVDTANTKPYEGSLTIKNRGEAYQISRQAAGLRYGGVAVQTGDAVAVTFAEEGKGKGCGTALFRIVPNGNLEGKIARWGEYSFGTEKAEKVEGNNFDGKYRVNGVTADGKQYDGSILVDKMGSGYAFTWVTTAGSLVGFGIWRGDRAAVSFGGKQCSFALYKVMSRRSLEGHWGSQREAAFSAETASR